MQHIAALERLSIIDACSRMGNHKACFRSACSVARGQHLGCACNNFNMAVCMIPGMHDMRADCGIAPRPESCLIKGSVRV